MAASKWTLRILLAVVVLLIPASAHAANNCPWLTEATVGGLLGGNAVGSYTAGPLVTTSTSATITPDAGPTVRMDQPGTCVFTDKEGAAVRELTVTMDVFPGSSFEILAMPLHRIALAKLLVSDLRNSRQAHAAMRQT